MFNYEKSREFFDPSSLAGTDVHIVGCGAVGAAVAELLVRLGLKELHIWDTDIVAPHNLGNQFYRTKDIGLYKTDCLKEILQEINPELSVVQHELCKKESAISGIIFLCIDNIDVRRELCTKWKRNPNIQFIQDGRMLLTGGNVHAAAWNDLTEKNNLINSMDYTHAEAVAQTPVSACGLALSVVCAPRTLASYLVTNFISFINCNGYYRLIDFDVYGLYLDAYHI